ncbi:hypothetical protein EII17_07965 [Clostridiales bacterium COT073_COT-073]|nr:hypothetical protein EII17_07965 [Clostridiales bacterium COT073_COT-073]
MPQWLQILLIVVAVLAIALVLLYYFGNKMQKKADASQEMIEQSKMVTSALIIDKKKLKAKDSSLPQMVQEQIPVYLRWRKLPMVKAKIGPKIATLLCDDNVYEQLPLKKMVKIELAGLYIVSIKSGKLETPVKLTWRQRISAWAKQKQAGVSAKAGKEKSK